MSDQHDLQNEYLSNIELLLKPFMDTINPDTALNIRTLVDHGEPAEGVNYLAWAIVNENIYVSGETVAKIKEYTDGLIDPEHMPSNLNSFIIK